MAMQGSGAISLSEIRVEHGGSAPDLLSDYYRNGVEGVPDTPPNASIPTSGAIKLSDFYGSSKLAVSPSNGDSDNLRVNNTCFAGVSFQSSGAELGYTNSGSISINRGNWLDVGSASEIWVQRVIDIGTLTVDPGSGRLQLSSSRSFNIQRTSLGIKTTTVTFNFYNAASSGDLIGSSQVVMTAEYSSGG